MEIGNTEETNLDKRVIKSKIVVCGSNAVGKTTLLRNISDQKLEKNYIPTLGVNVSTIQLNFSSADIKSDILLTLSIWDIAGQFFTRNLPIHKKFYNAASAAFVVYDITRKITYEDVPEWFKTIEKNVGKQIPYVLIGNKIDLKAERTVSEEEGFKMAEKFNCPFLETSALTGENVKESFMKMGILLINKNKN
ncbi:MAG: GTP-binding protein [Candidatus Lokiarchaeota archaeon]|nr:GTP-binding protein [Candidatus Lokiarchaeota archaeon]